MAVKYPSAPEVLRIGLFASWAAICTAALVQTVPDSPFAFGPRVRGNFASVLPQGWSFFTRNAREERLLLYEPKGKGWQLRSVTNAQSKHWLGIKRTSSLISVELAAITAQLPDSAWAALEGHLEAGAYAGPPAVTVTNPGIARTLCGRFLLRKQPPLPWAWADSPRLKELPSRVAYVEVRCTA